MNRMNRMDRMDRMNEQIHQSLIIALIIIYSGGIKFFYDQYNRQTNMWDVLGVLVLFRLKQISIRNFF